MCNCVPDRAVFIRTDLERRLDAERRAADRQRRTQDLLEDRQLRATWERKREEFRRIANVSGRLTAYGTLYRAAALGALERNPDLKAEVVAFRQQRAQRAAANGNTFEAVPAVT
jgi:hypothetical protein